MAGIFICYRRSDSAIVAHRIYDRLIGHFGRKFIFMDVDTIPIGVDFQKYLSSAVSESDVMLAIIGNGWLKDQQLYSNPLDNQEDFVRIEIEAALANEIPIVPILIGDTPLPKTNDLPHKLNRLIHHQAIRVDPTEDFHPHMDRLIKRIESLLVYKKTLVSRTVSLKSKFKPSENLSKIRLWFIDKKYFILSTLIVLLFGLKRAIILAIIISTALLVSRIISIPPRPLKESPTIGIEISIYYGYWLFILILAILLDILLLMVFLIAPAIVAAIFIGH